MPYYLVNTQNVDKNYEVLGYTKADTLIDAFFNIQEKLDTTVAFKVIPHSYEQHGRLDDYMGL